MKALLGKLLLLIAIGVSIYFLVSNNDTIVWFSEKDGKAITEISIESRDYYYKLQKNSDSSWSFVDSLKEAKPISARVDTFLKKLESLQVVSKIRNPKVKLEDFDLSYNFSGRIVQVARYNSLSGNILIQDSKFPGYLLEIRDTQFLLKSYSVHKFLSEKIINAFSTAKLSIEHGASKLAWEKTKIQWTREGEDQFIPVSRAAQLEKEFLAIKVFDSIPLEMNRSFEGFTPINVSDFTQPLILSTLKGEKKFLLSGKTEYKNIVLDRSGKRLLVLQDSDMSLLRLVPLEIQGPDWFSNIQWVSMKTIEFIHPKESFTTTVKDRSIFNTKDKPVGDVLSLANQLYSLEAISYYGEATSQGDYKYKIIIKSKKSDDSIYYSWDGDIRMATSYWPAGVKLTKSSKTKMIDLWKEVEKWNQ
ncbi:MAG: hypothetical protein AB8E15_04635 [Bdellovibrionales bacterium]